MERVETRKKVRTRVRTKMTATARRRVEMGRRRKTAKERETDE